MWFPAITGDLSTPPPRGVHGVTLVSSQVFEGNISLDVGLLQGVVVLKPEGSGTITLKSPSIYDKPEIDPKLVASW